VTITNSQLWLAVELLNVTRTLCSTTARRLTESICGYNTAKGMRLIPLESKTAKLEVETAFKIVTKDKDKENRPSKIEHGIIDSSK
jgi:hypothetical protein